MAFTVFKRAEPDKLLEIELESGLIAIGGPIIGQAPASKTRLMSRSLWAGHFWSRASPDAARLNLDFPLRGSLGLADFTFTR